MSKRNLKREREAAAVVENIIHRQKKRKRDEGVEILLNNKGKGNGGEKRETDKISRKTTAIRNG